MSLTDVRLTRSEEPKHAPPPRAKFWLYRFDTKTVPYLLIAPFFILFAIFGLFPIIFNGVVALRHWRLDDPTLTGWAGMENFTKLASDTDFWDALVNTFGIFILSTVPQLLIALMLANLLNRKLRGATFWRIGVLLPYVTPVAASTLVFAVFFSRDYGMANWLLSLVGFGEEQPLDWRATTWSSWIAIATMVNWKWIGYNALLYLSAMQAIPKDVYEAAAVDGAGPWRQLWRITVPMIQPVVLFTVILSTIGGLQLFNEPMLFDENPALANGGYDHQWRTIAQLIYKVGWRDLNLGYAAAMSWALFLIILIVAAINALATRRLGGGK
ncbi:sugar ABC transporter permease [Actinoplanes hulinensis]|uniref:ABC transporter permease n=2 Tax=Actinoplanes TaxID=1865 RepID=A0A7W5ABU6_9ACTN|nr:cellobiose transport system permease protein [Actinoplanes campanulatus]MBW6439001.1 sugar ABC transporter permease [Actinoplanes hulinensis]GGN02015.1 ABC transporter permease [Actinoplanes campanulatus]GID33688.1 ABC transporter permease [Actinoplanes campanulatus]GID44075.1 ABC transporter permease [Actinoplanes capillaceus]